MHWIAVCVICLNIATLQARHELNIKKIIEIIRRRNAMNNNRPILGAPQYPEHLPQAEPILPGHTLIRPALGMLKSAVKFPLRDTGDSLVYGNKANVGLGHDNHYRLRYSDFRKASKNDLLSALLHSIQERSESDKLNKPLVVKFQKQFPRKTDKYKDLNSLIADSKEDNNVREVLNKIDPSRYFFEENSKEFDFRRKTSKSKFRERNYAGENTSQETFESSESSSEQDTNPGNPYTIHKNKYKTNWMWNHFMDGDHVNINPYGPIFHNAGPSGPQLFFGRKWWYYNQDDYKPMG